MKGQPLNNYIIVKPNAIEEKTASGIIIPETIQEKSQNQGTVISVSEAIKEPQVKAGDQVVYSMYSKDKITIDGEEYLLMQESDLRFKI